MGIIERFVAAVESAPDRTGVRSSAGSLDYSGLERLSARYRDAVGAQEVGPGDVVVVDMPRSLEAVAAILGVVRAGAAYTVIRSDFPERRRRKMIEEVGARLVVGESFLDEAGAVPVLSDAARTADQLLYVVFTSGTTAVPKAVGVPDRAVLRIVDEPRLGLRAGAVVSHLSPIEFDASILELWGGLLHGMTLELVTPLEVLDAPRLLTRVFPECDIMWLTSSLFNFLVDKDVSAFGMLERVVVGGEALSLHHVRRALAHTVVVNGYGPTENTVFTTLDVMSHDVSDIRIGTPVLGTRVAVLDDDGGRARSGELVAMGEGLALGYLNRPEDEAFFELDGEPAYRTGDLVTIEDDGRLTFHGRRDSQIKLNGYRIDLGEVEAACLDLGAGTCKAFVEDGQIVVAITSGAAQLSTSLADYLPAYMRPRKVVQVARIPLTPNGKADLRALEELVSSPGEASGPSPMDPAADAVLDGVRRAVAESVDLRPEDVEGNLLRLGLDSIGLWKLIGRINSTFDTNVTFFDVIAEPTLERLVSLTRPTSHDSTQSPLPIER